MTFGKLIDKSAKEEVIHAKVVSAKEEVATSEEVTSIHAVKPSNRHRSLFYAVVKSAVVLRGHQ